MADIYKCGNEYRNKKCDDPTNQKYVMPEQIKPITPQEKYNQYLQQAQQKQKLEYEINQRKIRENQEAQIKAQEQYQEQQRRMYQQQARNNLINQCKNIDREREQIQNEYRNGYTVQRGEYLKERDRFLSDQRYKIACYSVM